MPVSKTKVVAAKPEKDVFFFKRQEVEWKKAGLYIVPFFFLFFTSFAQDITSLHKKLPCKRNIFGEQRAEKGVRRW